MKSKTPAKQLDDLLAKLKPKARAKTRRPKEDSQRQKHTPPKIESEDSPKRISEIINASEVAKLLKVKAVTVYSWAKAGEIPCIRKGRTVRFDKQAVLEWFMNREK